MLFQSKFSLFQHNARGGWSIYHPVTGVKTGEVKPLVADFGQLGDPFVFDNPLIGGKDEAVEIRGHFFDSDIAAERNGWTPEEKESVEVSLLEACQQMPLWVWVVDRAAEVAPEKPWASYDATKAEMIAEYAADLQLVEQALRYEEATKKRKSVLAALELKLYDQAQTAELTAAP